VGIWQVLNKARAHRENCLRAVTKLSGFLIIPIANGSSNMIAISQLDPRGYIPPTAIKTLNRMQVKLITRLAQHIQGLSLVSLVSLSGLLSDKCACPADVARASEQLLRHGDTSLPFAVSALYSYNCGWNQERVLNARSQAANLSLEDDDPESEEQGKATHSPKNAQSQRFGPADKRTDGGLFLSLLSRGFAPAARRKRVGWKLCGVER